MGDIALVAMRPGASLIRLALPPRCERDARVQSRHSRFCFVAHAATTATQLLQLAAGPKQEQGEPPITVARCPLVSGRPGASRRRAPLRTGRAPFNASGSSKPRRSVGDYALRSVPVGETVRPQVHAPRPMAAASRLSIGSELVVIVVFEVHLTTSARFRARAQGPVFGRLSATISRRALIGWSRFPAAFRLPALASWSSCSRQGVGRSSRSAYRPTAGPRRGFHVSHAQAATGVGALYIPGTTVLTRTGHDHQPASAASQRPVPTPRHHDPSKRGSASRDINEGSNDFTG
jgi:hypothetical protein